MINRINTLKKMKKTIILSIFALMLLSVPQKSHAFQLERLIDPACLFACDDGGSKSVVNNTTNYNTSTVSTPNRPPTNYYSNDSYYSNDDYYGSNYRESDYYPTYIPAPQRPVQVYVRPQPVYVAPPTPVYVYNDNYNYNYNQYNQLGVSCYPAYQQGNTGDTINWRASAYGGNGNYYISWTGSDGLNGNGSSISTSYYYPGAKTASITVTSAGQTITQNCGSVQINGNYNTTISVSCSANSTYTQVGGRMVWQSYVSGGNGAYSYNWYGTDNLNGYTQNLDTYYNTPGVKTAYVVVRSGNQTVTQYCSNTVTVGGYNYPTYPPVYTPPAPPAPPVKSNETTIIKYITVQPKNEVATTTVAPTITNTSGPTTISIPWGWISLLVIIILIFTIIYLIFSKRKM